MLCRHGKLKFKTWARSASCFAELISHLVEGWTDILHLGPRRHLRCVGSGSRPSGRYRAGGSGPPSSSPAELTQAARCEYLPNTRQRAHSPPLMGFDLRFALATAMTITMMTMLARPQARHSQLTAIAGTSASANNC